MKLNQLLEAKHVSYAEFFKCPDCKGRGGFYSQFGPDDIDVEMCELCQGKGSIKRDYAEHLVSSTIYKEDEFEPVNEARYHRNVPTIGEVAELYQEAANDFTPFTRTVPKRGEQSRVVLSRHNREKVEVTYEVLDNIDVVMMQFRFNRNEDYENRKQVVRDFIQKYNLPYTSISWDDLMWDMFVSVDYDLKVAKKKGYHTS
ncbi:MAG: hypothetical protein ACXADH_11080 [Candidatus Kariarchaeaceae archaeon]|jgi:hypothetical protein